MHANLRVCEWFSNTLGFHRLFFLCPLLFMSKMAPCRLAVEAFLFLAIVMRLSNYFLLWWCLVLHHLRCSLRNRCLGWFCSISFLMLQLITLILLLMSKIRWYPERLMRPMHASVWSLISGRCSCLTRWFVVLRQLPLFVILLKWFLFRALFTDIRAKIFESTDDTICS